MRKILLLFLLMATTAAAQTPTVVTGTITDASNVPYSFAKVSAQLIPTTASPTISVGGIPVAIGGQSNATADVNGTFSMNLFCNTAGGGCSVISPSGTRWQFTVTEQGVPPPLGTGPQAFSATINITGASQSVSATLAALAPLLSNLGAGLGSVTHTVGPLTAGQIVIGNGGADIKVDTGASTDGAGNITTTGTVTANIGSFGSAGFNFADVAGGAYAVGNANQCRYSVDGTFWPEVSCNTNAFQKLAIGNGLNVQTVNYAPVLSDCGKTIAMNNAALTLTLPSPPINSACEIKVENWNASSLTISRNGLTIDGAASNLTLTQNQGVTLDTDGSNYGTVRGVSGAGTVTSVSFTGGLISVGTPTTTPAFTVAGTSGGIPYFSGAAAWASSGALTANLPVIGGGAGATPTVGTVTGNTTQFATWTGATTSARCVDTDASGNLKITAADCNGVSSVFGRTGAVVAATNDYTLDQIGNPVAAVSFQPTIDAGFLFKQSNTANTVSVFHVQSKAGAETFNIDQNQVVRFQSNACTLSTAPFLFCPTVGTTFLSFGTGTICKANGTAANPSVAACGSAAAGMFSCDVASSTGTCQVNTTAVTANSQITLTQDSADGGASQLNVTCETTFSLPAAKPLLLSKSAGANFIINLGTIVTNPACFEYKIVN
jgi:hypothetical protein